MNILTPSFRILNKFFNNRDQNLKLLISRYLNDHPDISRNEVTRIVYGIARKEKLIEFIASGFVKRKLTGTDKNTLILLYIGIFLIHFSGSYPPYAVVNEIVETAPPRSRGFLNAVLRRVGREQNKIENLIDTIKDPLIKYSVSKEIYENLKMITENTDKSLKYLDAEPVFHVRVNQPDPDHNSAESVLKKKNISCRYIRETGSFEINDAGQMVREVIPEYQFYFQNSGSFAVSAVAASFKGEKILDCCSAPGTKSITLSLLRPEADILSLDINPDRLKLITPFLNSAGINNVALAAGNIISWPIKNIFDIILIDAPCTSAGTLRKNPDLKSKITKKTIEKNSLKQKQILTSVLSRAKKGSVIVYAVCSFIYNETEDVLNHSINESGKDGFEIVDVSKILKKYKLKIHNSEFGTYLLPDNKMNNDLFYISAIRKI
ncbi:MAG: RsmB/NOP family class I SAM-dependent RNA methyltransferase [Acidobacteriota bacterium]